MTLSIPDLTQPVLNIGIETLRDSLAASGRDSVQLTWRPPGEGDPQIAWLLARLASDPHDPQSIGGRIDAANAQAVERIIAARPVWEDVALCADSVWPDMKRERLLLHAGAPVAWNDMCGPMHGAMIGAVLYEGWAAHADEARALLERGVIRFAPCHDYQAVGPMTGIISPSMPLFVVRNASHGNWAYTNFNEGIGRVLRFGANSADVLERLKWFDRVMAPTLKVAVQQAGGIDLKSIQAQALHMGDEVHSRNAAATALLFMQLSVALTASKLPAEDVHATLKFISNTSQFFLNFSMVSAKAIMDAAHGIEASSVVTATARNGTTTAIRVSGLGGEWFEAPSDTPVGLFFPGYSQADANADLGDSAITETAGFGGCSFAASPALTLLAGGTVSESLYYSRLMHEITIARNPGLTLPALDFAGAPTGIDIRKVVDTGIRPVVTTGIAHKQAGIGQIGAGIVRPPMRCYELALRALAVRLGVK